MFFENLLKRFGAFCEHLTLLEGGAACLPAWSALGQSLLQKVFALTVTLASNRAEGSEPWLFGFFLLDEKCVR